MRKKILINLICATLVLGLVVDKQIKKVDNLIISNVSSEMRLLYLTIRDFGKQVFDEDGELIELDDDTLIGTIERADDRIMCINETLSSYKELNSNFDIRITSINNILHSMRNSLKENGELTNKEIEVLREMVEINGENYSLASNIHGSHINDNMGLTKLKMPETVNDYIEEFDNLAKELY